MELLFAGLIILMIGYWGGFWWGYLNRKEVARFLKNGRIDWK